MKISKKLAQDYKTTDLALVAVLQLFGYQIQKTERDKSGRVTFSVKNDNKLDRLIQDFWSRNLMIEPLSYFESLKATKSRIYQNSNNK